MDIHSSVPLQLNEGCMNDCCYQRCKYVTLHGFHNHIRSGRSHLQQNLVLCVETKQLKTVSLKKIFKKNFLQVCTSPNVVPWPLTRRSWTGAKPWYSVARRSVCKTGRSISYNTYTITCWVVCNVKSGLHFVSKWNVWQF